MHMHVQVHGHVHMQTHMQTHVHAHVHMRQCVRACRVRNACVPLCGEQAREQMSSVYDRALTSQPDPASMSAGAPPARARPTAWRDLSDGDSDD